MVKATSKMPIPRTSSLIANQMTDHYTLYGSYASYYTAKSRSYLRKKGIPFVERLPSDSLFRDKVRPASGSHRIPQLLTPEGQVVQDSVEMLDYLEQRYPHLPAIPATPKQRVFTHLMELFGSEGLVRLAWLHRWIFEENLAFVKMDFGRALKPHGNDEDLLKYGNLVADRMMSYGLPESTPELRHELEQKYIELLEIFESHLQHHPYFLGGHPSAADYAVMGAFHAHMGRDPAGLRTMQNHAPRVFRWVEHMLTPEVQSPEFFDRPVEWLADDAVPATATQLLHWIADNYGGKQFVLSALAFNQLVQTNDWPEGHCLDEKADQPTLEPVTVSYRGADYQIASSLHPLWLSQRARIYYRDLSEAERTQVAEFLGCGYAHDLLEVPVARTIVRRDQRLYLS